jgi:hypothetical protein
VVFFLVAGGLDVVVFASHAHIHPFWTLGLAGAFHLAGAWGLVRLWRLGRPLARVAAALVLTAACVWGAWRTLDEQDQTRTDAYVAQAAMINGVVGTGDVIITPEPWLQTAFYVDAFVVPSVGDVDTVLRLIEEYQRHGVTARIRVFLPAARLYAPPIAGIRDFVAPFCPEPERVGPYLLYTDTPGG